MSAAAAAARERRAMLPPGSARAVGAIGVLSVLRALALVMVAGSLATSIAALAGAASSSSSLSLSAALSADASAWRDALLLGAGGALLRAASVWAIGVVASREATAAKSRLRAELAERIAEGGVDGGSTAVLATTGLDDLDEYYGAVIPSMISAVVVPVGLTLSILSVDWLSALIIVLTVPLIPLFMILIGMHTRERADAAASSLARLSDHLVELARGLPVLVGLGRVEEQTAALDGVQREWRTRTSRMLRTAFMSALALELIATLSVAVVAVVLGLRLLSGSIGLEAALLVLLLAPDCFGALREVGAAYHSAQDGRAALDRVRKLLGQRPAARTIALGGSARASARAAVRELTVRYPGRGTPVIAGVTLAFPRGVITAITAPSGAGKSTLLAALAGTLPADATVSGEFVGIDPSRVAYVPQAPSFFGSTVAEELELWGDGSAWDAAGPARTLGLDALRDRRISELSPGEQRRLAVLRAVLRVEAGATLVLLDEPTAHLDAENAAEVRDAIRRMRRRAAVVLVSHDPATVGIANRVIPLPTSVAVPGAGASVRVQDDVRASGLDRSEASPSLATGPAGPAAASTGVLRSLLVPARGRWALAVLLGVLAVGCGLALTAVSAWLIVRAAEHPEIMYLSVAIVGVRFFGLGRSVARYAERLVTHDALFIASDALRLRVWRAIAARGAGSRRLLEGESAIDYLVTSIDQLRELVPRVVTPLIVGALSLLGVIVTVALVDSAAALLVAVALLGALALALLLATRHDRASLPLSAAHNVGENGVPSTRAARDARPSDVVQATQPAVASASTSASRVAARALLARRFVALADAAPDLRANGLAPRAVASVVDADRELAAADRRVAGSAGLGVAVLSFATAALAVLVPVLAGTRVLGAGVAAEAVAVVALLALASIDPLGELLQASRRVPALRAVLATLQPFAGEQPRVMTGDRRLDAPVTRLELDRLAARWPAATASVFTEVEAAVSRGSWLVVDGPSGAGKSTLLSILLGTLAPSAGGIRVDGVPLADLDAADWRTRVAWCPQDAHVFDSTIRGNLLLGRPRTDPVGDAEMHEVLGRVGLGELMTRLSAGLDARVGAAGTALSGGERQRLAVARALLGRSELLLLDEPTAHLDAPTAAAMMDDLRAATRDRIVVLVTHRADDRRLGDLVVSLDASDSRDPGMPPRPARTPALQSAG